MTEFILCGLALGIGFLLGRANNNNSPLMGEVTIPLHLGSPEPPYYLTTQQEKYHD